MVIRTGLVASILAIALLGMCVAPVGAQSLTLEKGQDVALCKAYRNHLARHVQLQRLLACGERLFDHSSTGISAPRWQRLEFKKHFALYQRLQEYEIGLKAAAGSWSKEEIDVARRVADRVAGKVDTTMWHTVIDLGSDSSAEHVVLLQQGDCLTYDSLTDDEVKTSRQLNIDLGRRLRNRKPGGVIYVVNKELTDIDQTTHERFLGPGGGSFGLFMFQGRPYLDAFDAQQKAEFFGPGTFTVMDTLGAGRDSVCEVNYQP